MNTAEKNRAIESQQLRARDMTFELSDRKDIKRNCHRIRAVWRELEEVSLNQSPDRLREIATVYHERFESVVRRFAMERYDAVCADRLKMIVLLLSLETAVDLQLGLRGVSQ